MIQRLFSPPRTPYTLTLIMMENKQGQWFVLASLLLLALAVLTFSYIGELEEGVYGGFEYFNSTGADFNFVQPNTYYEFYGGECGLTNKVSCNQTNITIQEEGVYRITYGATGVGDNNHLYITAVSINDVIQNNTRDLMETSAQEMKKMRGDGEFLLSEGDVVKLEIQDTTSSSSGVVFEFDLNLQRVGY